MTNFADQATEYWGTHLFLKAKISDAGRRNKDRAIQRVDRDFELKVRPAASARQREILIALEHKRLNDNDILRKNMIDEATFAREQAVGCALLAQLHGHTPTVRIEP